MPKAFPLSDVPPCERNGGGGGGCLRMLALPVNGQARRESGATHPPATRKEEEEDPLGGAARQAEASPRAAALALAAAPPPPPRRFPSQPLPPVVVVTAARPLARRLGLAMDPAALLLGHGGPLLLLGLAIFNCVAGNGNTTEHEAKTMSCSYPNGNCTDGTTGLRRRGHFSKCPEEYKHYCIKGRCRYVTVEQIPACICEKGYTGARCERLDLFYLRGDQGQIVVISLIAVMVLLIILIACICICTHYCRKKHKKRKEEEMGTFEKRLPVKTEDFLETDIA